MYNRILGISLLQVNKGVVAIYLQSQYVDWQNRHKANQAVMTNKTQIIFYTLGAPSAGLVCLGNTGWLNGL
jgi:hypothetical protein